ncbi:MAG: sensor histidine kinase [Planctomycetota bacterium]
MDPFAFVGQLGALGKSLNAVVFITAADAVRTPVFATMGLVEVLGYTPEEWIAQPSLYWDTILEGDRERVRRECEGYLTQPGPFHLKYRRRARDGRELWIREHFVVGRNQVGMPDRVEGVMLDSSEVGILNATLTHVLSARDVDQTVQTFARLLLRHLGFDYGGYVSVSEPERSLLLHGAAEAQVVVRAPAPLFDTLAAMCRAFPTSGPLELEETELALPDGPHPDRVAGSVLFVPVPRLSGTKGAGGGAEAELCGALVGLRPGAGRLTRQQRRVAAAMGIQLRAALERARLVETLERLGAERLALSRALLRAQEEERARLSLALHDGAGQLLTGAMIQLDVAAQAVARLGQDDVAGAATKAIAASRACLEQTLDELRGLSQGLRPLALDRLGLREALLEAVAQLDGGGPKGGVSATVSADVPEDLPRLGAEVETALFRVAQAALTNAARHAQARSIRLAVACEPGEVELTVTDDGKGIEPIGTGAGLPDLSSSGLGLLGMRERAEELGGRLVVEAAVAGGTRVCVRVPYGES